MCFSGGKKDDASTKADQFTNRLTLELGPNASNLCQLTGETTSFTAPLHLKFYWRLESKDEMAGSAVTVKIEKSVNDTYTAVQNTPYPNPQTYGHFMLSAFRWTPTGSVRGTGILTSGTKTVAPCDFTVK